MQERICAPRSVAWLLVVWALLQAGDVITTYWGLRYPTITEANPVMATVIDSPLCVVLVKFALTTTVAAVLLGIERRTPYSAVPILVALNAWMFFVCLNNSTLIAQATGVLPAASLLSG